MIRAKIYKDTPLSVSDVVCLTGVSKRQVHRLAAQGVLKRPFTTASIREYITGLRNLQRQHKALMSKLEIGTIDLGEINLDMSEDTIDLGGIDLGFLDGE
ncbi:hypothetical protein NBG4_890010 [Candidatus Sulfobium mesophilum]|uniref:Uncharacterized protein n=1 Tax=Candidatus Sulfobium mesophilum TaxID=2016548 RepID=A0A2U3QKZ4_9BACT|nr:hypothetical protein NBG4_890010 [Candidatus Sulfobium mesophilum]